MARAWREAYAAADLKQFFRTIVPTATGKSESFAIPNLGSRCVGIALHGSIIVTASAAENAVSAAKIIDLLDNLILTDAAGKTKIHIKPRTLYNYAALYMNEVPAMDALTNFAGAGSSTFTFDIVIPVSIAPTEGIYHLQFDYALTNCYAADTIVATGSTIDMVGIYADVELPTWKIADISKAFVSGNNQINELESNRGWYGLIVQGVAALSDIDDVTIKSANQDLISAEFPDLYAQFLQAVLYTPRVTGDIVIGFRPHVHLTTDFVNFEGTTTGTLTIAVIAEADQPTRSATAAEVTAPSSVMPAVVSQSLGGAPASARAGFRLPGNIALGRID